MLIKQGKTKDIYALDSGDYLLKFKDDATGEGGVFDPGANQVGLTIEGLGKAGLALTVHFFTLLRQAGIATHFLSACVEKSEMTVRKASHFGNGVEVICRFKAIGSFYRRYGSYITEGTNLDGFIEFTLKDDERQDPPISKEALIILGIMTENEYDELVLLTRKISDLILAELVKKGLTLYDIKLEFGKVNGEVILIDEISAGNMRVYKDGRPVDPVELAKMVLNEDFC